MKEELEELELEVVEPPEPALDPVVAWTLVVWTLVVWALVVLLLPPPVLPPVLPPPVLPPEDWVVAA